VIETEATQSQFSEQGTIHEDVVAEMVSEIKGYKVLTGVRGEPPKDIEAVKDVIQKLSYAALAHPEIKEIDLKPVIVHEKGISLVDARIIIG